MRGGQLRGLGSRDSKRDLFSRLLFRELRGEPRTVKLDSVRAVSIESILDVEGVLKSCVLLGFSRSGDQLISYSTAADGEFSLEVWHFLGVGKRVQLASRSALFRSEDGPSGSQSDGWDRSPLVITVAELGDNSCLIVHGQQAADEGEHAAPLRNFVTVVPLPVDTYRATTLRAAHWSYITLPPHPAFDATASMGCPGFLLLPTGCEVTSLGIGRRAVSSRPDAASSLAGERIPVPGSSPSPAGAASASGAARQDQRRQQRSDDAAGAGAGGDDDLEDLEDVPGVSYTECLWSPPRLPRLAGGGARMSSAAAAAGPDSGQPSDAQLPQPPLAASQHEAPTPAAATAAAAAARPAGHPPPDLCEASISHRRVFDAEEFIARLRLGSAGGEGGSSGSSGSGRLRVLDYDLQVAMSSPQPSPFALVFLAVALERPQQPPAPSPATPAATPPTPRRDVRLLGLAAEFDLRSGASRLLCPAPLQVPTAVDLTDEAVLKAVLSQAAAGGAESLRRRGGAPRRDGALPFALSNAAAVATMASYSVIRHPVFPVAVLGYGSGGGRRGGARAAVPARGGAAAAGEGGEGGWDG